MYIYTHTYIYLSTYLSTYLSIYLYGGSITSVSASEPRPQEVLPLLSTGALGIHGGPALSLSLSLFLYIYT